MKNTPIESLKPFTEAGDWRTMMATMVEPALRETISAHSKTMNLAWMKLVVEGDLLRLPNDFSEQKFSPYALVDAVEKWTSRLRDFTQFASQVSEEITAKNDKDGDAPSVSFLAFGATPEVKALFARTSEIVAQDHATITAHPLYAKMEPELDVDKTMGMWLAGAVVLDLPDAVAAFAKAVPQSLGGQFSIEFLGQGRIDSILPRENTDGTEIKGRLEVDLTAQGVAMLMSRDRCLDALWANGASVHDSLGTHRTMVNEQSVHTVDFYVDDCADVMLPMGLASTWEKMLKKGMEEPSFDPEEKEKLYALGIRAMVHNDDKPYLLDCLEPLVNAGVYDATPAHAMSVACVQGFPKVLDAMLEKVDWSSPLTKERFNGRHSPLVQGPRSATPGRSEAIEHCVVSIMKAAEKAGHGDLVAPFLSDNKSEDARTEPLQSFVDAHFKNAILLSLAKGWNSKSNPPGFEDAPTLIDYADKFSPESAHTIRSHDNRNRAFEALEGIQKSMPKPGRL